MDKKVVKWASLGKKITMAIFGLFLALFLLVHLTINLLMLANDGGVMFSQAAAFMGSTFVKPFEVILFLAFIVHIIAGVIVWVYNQKSRPVKYKTANKTKTSGFSKFMIHTGVIIFIFLVLHIMQFWWQKVAHHNHEFYDIAQEMFTGNILWTLIYVVSFIALAFHMNHAFQSGFQTLGWASEKYTPVVKKISTVYAIIIGVGFSIIPIIFYFSA